MGILMQADLFGGEAIEDDSRLETKRCIYQQDGNTLIVIEKRHRSKHQHEMRGMIHKTLRDNVIAKLHLALFGTAANMPHNFFRKFMSEADMNHEYADLTGNN